MTNKEISDSIFENYYSFLGSYKNINECKYYDLDFCKSIIAKDTSWPNFVYDIKEKFSTNNIKFLLEKIKQNKTAHTLMLNNLLSNTNNETLLRYGYKKVVIWKAMALDFSNFTKKTTYKLNIKIVENKREITDWINIVKKELKISFSITQIVNILSNNNINLFVGYYNNTAISTALTYKNKQIVGHYMIATLKEHTKKGFGTEIMNFSIDYCRNNGSQIGVLASSAQGKKLYAKLGYNEYDCFNIYWKLPSTK